MFNKMLKEIDSSSLGVKTTNRYSQISIKNCERSLRAATGLQIVQITRPEQRTTKNSVKISIKRSEQRRTD